MNERNTAEKNASPNAHHTDDTRDAREEYLYEYLQEEFRKISEIRIQIRKEDGERGILVRSEARQWFFPFEWASGHGFREVHQQVAKIREIFE